MSDSKERQLHESDVGVESSSESDPIQPQPEYPSGLVLGVTILALCISVFCVALDMTIISTAIPKITDQFHALNDVGWYGSAYLLTTCAFQLPFGKVYGIFSPKWTFLVALALFEVGSLICAVAPSSVVLIVGRAIAGIGAAGVFSGALVIIAYSSSMEKRPMYQSMLGGMFGIASVVGPMIGGAFTDKATWRWCFYINLPLGGFTAIVITFFLHLNTGKSSRKSQSFWSLLWSLDPIGFMLFVPSIICVLLALQWGGTTYPWSNGRIIALFVVFGLALIGFAVVQVWLGENATLPPRIATHRTVWAASLFSFCLSGAFFLLIYYIPIYFQAIKGIDALHSGIDSIPLILSNVVGIILAGALTTKLGHYMPFIYSCVLLTSIGSGLLTTLEPHTTSGKWIGYQILFGFGCGCGFQLPQIAAQAVLPFEDVQTGIAITLLFQNFGGAIFVSVGGTVLDEHLLQYISDLDAGVDPEAIIQAGATACGVSFRVSICPL
ncbi:hypothetical protein ABOM_008732 [Aspergillus bombycis]|uniref:Major facilitator superfamily (MFS) profile domain-containing protein n=1 Tax=Aspergillus bombycis TaxID=109264 RepID=A0A1F7ZWB5_9EURO|nr:hypothetical protein ABOM_008732 [Aspergillus bombycis]OGM43338.1 hypothetical protein ABOM_008732 [Aspergillus bombycis]